ncbi:hypothetical protein T08_9141 [Trichinella sp. T8]|nr:hypothetical protein T08_9141 [Trichinella sp. T8]
MKTQFLPQHNAFRQQISAEYRASISTETSWQLEMNLVIIENEQTDWFTFSRQNRVGWLCRMMILPLSNGTLWSLRHLISQLQESDKIVVKKEKKTKTPTPRVISPDSGPVNATSVSSDYSVQLVAF